MTHSRSVHQLATAVAIGLATSVLAATRFKPAANAPPPHTETTAMIGSANRIRATCPNRHSPRGSPHCQRCNAQPELQLSGPDLRGQRRAETNTALYLSARLGS